jgi:hypothetical protein
MDNEEKLLIGFGEYLISKGLKEKSVNDDFSRIRMMNKRNIDCTKGENYARKYLELSDLSDSSITSCLRVCRYYKEYLDQRV